jgi:mRNA-degrading endonuclease RelE of RelBE toxin-antitoxin system
VLKLEGEGNRWRRRVGSYRIFFILDTTANTVAVSAIVRDVEHLLGFIRIRMKCASVRFR